MLLATGNKAARSSRERAYAHGLSSCVQPPSMKSPGSTAAARTDPAEQSGEMMAAAGPVSLSGQGSRRREVLQNHLRWGRCMAECDWQGDHKQSEKRRGVWGSFLLPVFLHVFLEFDLKQFSTKE